MEVECAECGAILERGRARVERYKHQFCDKECHGAWRVGKPSPRRDWRERTCERCGESFTTSPSAPGKFCSQDCYHSHVKETGAKSGENNPMHKPKVTLVCGWCEDEFEEIPSRADRRKYCSRDCLARAKASVTGFDHPLYNGGVDFYRSVRRCLPGNGGWHSIRERELADECEVCGESPGRLDLHHIVPVLRGGTNESWNLMTLCPSCHSYAESTSKNLGESLV